MVDWSQREYFKPAEFECKCCNEVVLDDGFMQMLDLARSIAEVPFTITSGYRCQAHNKAVGSKPTSSHPLGLAVDIKASGSRHRFTIVSALLDAGFSRIGIGSDFIHVDNDQDKTGFVIWLYS